MKRRDFSKMAGLGVLAMHSFPTITTAMLSKNEPIGSSKVPIGVCNHSLRGMNLKAKQLVEYAIEHKLDSVLVNDFFTSFESLESEYITEVSNLARAHDISIYIGAFSISKTALMYREGYESAEARLLAAIRLATAVGSPIVATRIGYLSERYREGGMEVHIKEVIRVQKAVRGPALDAGIKFAIENHEELRTEELLRIIYETGTDICGALLDPANAVGVMEDPIRALHGELGKHILCTSARDYMVYETEEGATMQCTTIGNGLMDYKYYTNFLAENCPGVPIHVETVGSRKKSIPFLQPEFWKGFPDLPATAIVDFLKLIRLGHPLKISEAPAGTDKKKFEIEQQQSELQKSVDYLRRECGAGLKS
ncbi:MAG: sugar phosphate isomerase/epimerase [Bacteroidales bacterium]|jgi:sugar phosphate isomerase/epimerase|nr:sugar phosphate isomerase/epimerase [Bacteroidales bacterium]